MKVRTAIGLCELTFVVGVLAALTACVNAAHVSGSTIHVSREILRLDDNAARYPNVYDAIEHLRPEYLRVIDQGSTTMEPVAYLDGVRLADPSMLRLLPVSWALEVRWVRPNQTSPLYGSSHHLGGGIFVRTR